MGTPYISYYLGGLLRQPNAEKARDYLGIVPVDVSGLAGTGTVTSVGLSAPGSMFSVSGSPVIASGTLSFALINQNANLVLSGPSSGAAAAPTFRSLVEADTTLSDVTTNNSTAGRHGYLPKLSGNVAEFLTGTGTWVTPAGSGTVTSVGMTVPSFLSVAGSPVTTSGTLAVSLANQSANLVFSGPSSGGAATPTFRSLVEADTTLSDITTNDVSTTKHGYCPKGSGVAGEFLNSSGAWATPAAGSDWDGIITKSSDQTVTNNATPQNDSELFFSMDASSQYQVQLLLFYSGNNTTGDYRFRFNLTASTSSMGNYVYVSAALAATQTPVSGSGGGTQWPSTDGILGTDAADTIFPAIINFLIVTSSAQTCQYQFANSSAAAGRTSTTRAGSTLRYKKLYP